MTADVLRSYAVVSRSGWSSVDAVHSRLNEGGSTWEMFCARLPPSRRSVSTVPCEPTRVDRPPGRASGSIPRPEQPMAKAQTFDIIFADVSGPTSIGSRDGSAAIRRFEAGNGSSLRDAMRKRRRARLSRGWRRPSVHALGRHLLPVHLRILWLPRQGPPLACKSHHVRTLHRGALLVRGQACCSPRSAEDRAAEGDAVPWRPSLAPSWTDDGASRPARCVLAPIRGSGA
jgi:hypothetical protein